MKCKHLVMLTSLLAISFVTADGDFSDFCTLSGTIKGLNDFSSTFVKLFNKQGNLKETTEVSESGFFVLPIYDKGFYTIRVAAPAGYSFEPEEISLNFDGVNDACSQKKDVNFMFKGFGITGKVTIYNNPLVGAKDVAISLFGPKNQLISKTKSNEQGVFAFSPVSPGSYRVVASHDSWHFSKAEHSLTVSTGNTNVNDGSLEVSGFNLVGSVAQPTARLGFLVYSEKDKTNLYHKCEETMPAGNLIQTISTAYNAKPLCFTANVRNNEFTFRNLASGRYLILPHVGKNEIEFNISPSSIETIITSDNQQLSEPFHISGFTASGRVLLEQQNEKGIADAKVKLNGKIVATTDLEGHYSLKNIKEGTYTIQVSKEDLQFQDHTVKISMMNPNVPQIFVSGFKVCGKVVSDQSYKVAIKKHGSTFYTEAESVPSDDGNFCTFLANGQYSIEVLIGENDKNSIRFYPIQQVVEVKSASLTDIIFSQLRAKVTGIVQCLSDDENSCKNIDVSLSSLDENGYQTSTQKAKITNGAFTFEDILPGRYHINVPSNILCWEKEQQSIVVKSTIENVPKFVQTGYKVAPIIASHNSKVSYKLRRLSTEQKSVENDIELTSGANVICVEKPGTYDLKVESKCHTYEEDMKTLSTNSQTPIYINAIKHQNGIRILSEIDQQFTIEVEFEDGVHEILSPVKQIDKVDGYVAYIINLKLGSGERVILIPKSEQMLFKPDKTEWKGSSDCVDVAFNFIATKGLVVSGKTEPTIEDVTIQLVFTKNPELSALVTTTNSAGEFKFPTIDPTLDYELKAEKESYIFSEYDSVQNVFSGQKLSEIIVSVKDEDKNELPGVVISIGGDNYRKNLVTASNGEIKFHSLKHGKYYLRAMKKEYDFNPNSQTIEIKDGDTLRINLIAKRVQYSVLGRITTLSGDPFSNVMVEAISVSEACGNHQEEAMTEFNGQYRIRGLQTGCDYKIRLQKTPNVERSIPTERAVHVETSDIENINLIAMNPINICDVIVKVKCTNNEHYKSLRIQMYKKDSPDTPFYSQRLENLMSKAKDNENILVHLTRIQANDYNKVFFIELTSTLSERNYNYKLPSIQFTANTSSIYHVVEFFPTLKQPESELNKNSLVALLLMLIVAFVFFKYELVFETVKNLLEKINSDVTGKPATRKTEGSKDLTRSHNFIDEKEINQLAQFIEERKKKKSKKNN